MFLAALLRSDLDDAVVLLRCFHKLAAFEQSAGPQIVVLMVPTTQPATTQPAAAINVAKVEERTAKLNKASDILDLLSWARTLTFKAIAVRDVKLLEEA